MLQSTIETSRYTLIIATSLVPGFLVLSLAIYNMKQVDVLLPLHTIALMGQAHRCQLIHLELANHPLCLTWHRCARVPLSAWYGSAVPGERSVSCGGHRRKKTAAFCVNVCSRNAVIGDRAFFIAAPRVWNSLPSSVTASQTLNNFRHRMKTHLFAVSLT